jgi:hypothetical protein
VTFLLSPDGEGCGLCPGRFGGLCLDVLAPVRRIGNAVADATGTATLSFAVPGSLPFAELSTQAAIRRGTGGADSVKSQPVTAPVLDP